MDEMYCAVCGRETAFEQPPCADGHDDECPEWVCTVCAAAVMLPGGYGGVTGDAAGEAARRLGAA